MPGPNENNPIEPILQMRGKKHKRGMEMNKRNVTTITRSVLVLVVMVMLLSLTHLMTLRAGPAAHTKEGSMNLASTLETKPAEIPLIDAATPAGFETASFGLG